MDIYRLIASWVGWPIIVAFLLLAIGYGYWILTNRINQLKEKNSFLELQLSEAKNYTPDILVTRLASRLKLISDELERLHSDEEMNKQRIIELEYERDKILKTQRNFMLIAAHELKTPLTVLIGYTSMLLESNDSDVNSLLLKGISSATERLEFIIGGMLDISMSDSSEDVLEE